MVTDVFVVDDHAVVRDGVRLALAQEPGFRVVGEADSIHSGLTGILGLRPDVALVDVRLTDGTGIELIREVRSAGVTTCCLIFTSFPDVEAYLHAMMAGAAGFVLKDEPREVLIEALGGAADGGERFDRALLDRLQARAAELNPAQLLADLTEREQQILELIASGATNREIAAELYLAEKTVRNYVSNLLAKLGMQRRTEAAVFYTQVEHHEG
jgi:two-component system, NarL family, response regulator DevR